VLSGAPIVRRELGSAVVSESDGSVHADGEFEVMCLIRVPDEALIFDDTVAHTAAFRRVLSQLGESVVVIGGVPDSGVTVWSAHVHTNMPDQAITALESELPGVVLSQVVVRNLERQVAVSDGSGAAVRLVVCTSGPLLALDLARAGAVVCVERAQELGVADVERALTEVHGASEEHGGDHETALDAVVIVNSSRLSRELENMSRVVGTVVAIDDAQVVAATSAVLTAWEHEPELAAQRLTEIGQDCVDSLVTMRVEVLDRPRLAPLVNEIAVHERGVPVVTLLTDRACPPSAIADLTDGLERAHADAEVIVLGSGTLGNGLTASVEWIDD
jgi:dihydroxyacetone kinase-like predicted kinase